MIEMQNIFVVLDRLIEMVHEVDGLEVTDTEDTKERAEARSYKAEVSRKLLEIADGFALCESLVRAEYWVMKGRGVDIEVGLYVE